MNPEFDDDLLRVEGTYNRAYNTIELARKTKSEVAEVIVLLKSGANRVEQSTELLKRTDLVISALADAYVLR